MKNILITYPFLKTVIKIIAVMFLTSLVLSVMKKGVKRYTKKNGSAIHIRFIYNLSKAVVVIAAFATIGSEFKGFSQAVNTILASSGILALGASLAAQESMTNIIDGIFISMFKPYNIGDRVSLPEKNGLTGTITEMNLRHTVITTFSNTSYIIPNSQMSTAIIENSNFNNKSYSYPVDVSISYHSNLQRAMQLIEKAIVEHPEFIDTRTDEAKANGVPVLSVSLREFAASGINLRAMVTVSDVSKSFKTCSDIRIRIKELFDENGVEIPFQTVTVIHREPEFVAFEPSGDNDWEGK